MAIIWGFDISQMHWAAFRHKRMFDRRWHLRRERFVIYQLAMLICLAAECAATYSLSKYESQQTHIEVDSGHTAQVHNDDIIAAECLTIVFCVFVATLFGAEFFFLLFWPRRLYPRWYTTTKKILAVGITLGVLASALMSTIIVATRSVIINGVGPDTAEQYASFFYRPPLKYRDWPVNIVYVVLLWLGFVATAASTIVLFVAASHDKLHGTAPNQNILEDDRPMVGEKGELNTKHTLPS